MKLVGREPSLSGYWSRFRGGSSRSLSATSAGPVLARFLRPAPHFFPTEPIRDSNGVLPVDVCPTSGRGSSRDVGGGSRPRLELSGVDGREGSWNSVRSSSSKMPSSKLCGGRDFLRRRLRSR